METCWRSSAALVLLSATLATAGEARRSVDDWEVLRQPVKPFVVKDLAGKPLRLADLAGKIAVVDFWATWCKPCIRELPELAAYHQRLADRDDVVLLSFNVGDTRAEVERFLKTSPVSFPVYFGDALDEPLELAAFPTKLILDVRKPGPKGTALLRYRSEGYTDVASIEDRVEELLREAP